MAAMTERPASLAQYLRSESAMSCSTIGMWRTISSGFLLAMDESSVTRGESEKKRAIEGLSYLIHFELSSPRFDLVHG